MRNFLHINCDLSEHSLQWALQQFNSRAQDFQLEVHPDAYEEANRRWPGWMDRISGFKNTLKVVPTYGLDQDEWYLTSRVSWGSRGVRHATIGSEVRGAGRGHHDHGGSDPDHPGKQLEGGDGGLPAGSGKQP